MKRAPAALFVVVAAGAAAASAPAGADPAIPFETRGGRVALGVPPRELSVTLVQGRLRLLGVEGELLHETPPSVHVYGWAAAPVRRAGRPDFLVWMARRDATADGTVPHDSGWMAAAAEPWIHMHLAIVGAVEGGGIATRWLSSALGEVEGAWVEAGAPGAAAVVALRERSAAGPRLRRYAFRGFALEVVGDEPAGDGAPAGPPLLLADVMAAGDVMVGRETGRLLDRHGHEAAFEGVRPLLKRADFRMGNLESCFGDDASPSSALRLEAPPRQRAALRALGLDLLSVANNHCSPAAALASRDLLAEVGIATVGIAPEGGSPLDDVRILEQQGLRIAVAGLTFAGAGDAALRAFMDEGNAARLRAIRARADALLLSIHWGQEYRSEPSEAQRELARWLLERGADGILGHHPHVVGPVERVGRGFVAYSLGNFLFDQEGHVPAAAGATERGLVLEVRLHATLGWALREHPTCIVERHRIVPAPPG